MRIVIITDLEGVAGVRNFADWTRPECRYYDVGRELLTMEVNAAIEGFFQAGAKYIMVVDGHGPGAIDIMKLDPRVELLRGGSSRILLEQENSFDAVAFVGQHAKSRTPYSNMAHTQSCSWLEFSINGIAIGEFGQIAMYASELGIQTIFASGELAFTREAQELVPAIETVAVKRGTVPGRGDECTKEQYEKRNSGAIHIHPMKAREMICAGAKKAVKRFKTESFGIIPLKPPYRYVVTLRPTADESRKMYSIQEHPDSVREVLKMPFDLKPVKSDKQLKKLLVD